MHASQSEIFARLGAMLSILMELAFVGYVSWPGVRKPLLAISIVFHAATFVFLGIAFEHMWVITSSLLMWLHWDKNSFLLNNDLQNGAS